MTDLQTRNTTRLGKFCTKAYNSRIAGIGPSNHNFAWGGPRERCHNCGVVWFEAPGRAARRRSSSGCIHFAPAQLCHGQHHGRQGELSTRARLETCSKVRLCVCMRMWVCVYINMHTYTGVYTLEHTHTHTHTKREREREREKKREKEREIHTTI